MSEVLGYVERHRLARRLNYAVADIPTEHPFVVIDLDAFDANAADLTRRAAGTPIRVASKSLRVPALLRRALARDGFAGVLGYTLDEALWLLRRGISDDVVLGYPTVDTARIGDLLADEAALAGVTLMIDDPAHLDLVDSQRGSGPARPVRVAIDIDAGLRLRTQHVGPKRSPLHEVDEVLGLARAVAERPGFRLVGAMTYEGQVAGVPDEVPNQRAKNLIVKKLKAASITQLAQRRAELATALAEVAELEFFNAGGSGSVEASAADPVVTEVSAGSGLLVPTLFDHYETFEPRPAAFFGVPVVRCPGPGIVTVAGGGLVASGPAGKDRLPVPWAPPGLHLTGLEGAGEVQTPLTGSGTVGLEIGDLVWFRHAKAGELAEHVTTVHLLAGDHVVESTPTYRGAGHAW